MATTTKSRKVTLKENPKDEGVSNYQAIIYLAIVVVCFGVLYPRILHPMLKVMLGFGATQEQPKPVNDVPPHMRGQPMPGKQQGMRPPPGARGDSGRQGQSDSTGGSKGGIMAMILPVYAIGIVLYLVYAASKVWGGEKSKKKKKRVGDIDDVYSLITERLAGLDLQKVLTGEDVDGAEEINKIADYLREKKRSELDDDSDEENVNSVTPQQQIPKSTKTKKSRQQNIETRESNSDNDDDTDIEDLMRKCASTDPMDKKDMDKLQARLAEVESRMSKIMGALKVAKEKTTEVSGGEIATHRTNGITSSDNQGEQNETKCAPIKVVDEIESDGSDFDEDSQPESTELASNSLDYSDDSDDSVELITAASLDSENMLSGTLRKRLVVDDDMSDESENS